MQNFALDPSQEQEVTYISGIAANGTLAPESFWTWDNDEPATYGAQDDEAKYGPRLAGTGSGEITFSFAASSNWTPVEQNAFEASMALWSEVANVNFELVPTGGDFTITRGSDGSAEAGTTEFYPGTVGGTTLGHPTTASLSIDTSVAGFGPLGGPFNEYGGYPWTTMVHELGHILGLGHSGAYDEGVTTSQTALTPDDSRAYSVMSYLDPAADPYNWTITSVSGAREEGSPITPQELDIVALERIYGLPTTTPLSGGQTFGFNCNVQGVTEPFFDFTQNTQPIVTLWDEGAGNTLDVSGFSQAQTINLQGGAFSSIGGLSDNVAIALGTQIDHAIGGTGADMLIANNDGDTMLGGLGNDTLQGGAGVDALYGGGGNDFIVGGSAAGAFYGGQGDDHISGAGYLSGDLGDDVVDGHGAADTIVGGDGNDTLDSSGAHAVIYGNAGADYITVEDGSSATVYGGQGNDTIAAGAGDSYLSGDLGNDVISGGSGHQTLLGGDGDDTIQGAFTDGHIYGNAGNDVISVSGAAVVFGGAGDDLITSLGTTGQYLSGDLGNDTITGGFGADTIVGGAGADLLQGDPSYDPNAGASLGEPPHAHAANVFLYLNLSDSAPSTPDQILDFDPSLDTVNINAIDASQAAAHQTVFHWVNAFDGGAGEAEVAYDASTNTTSLMLDANGDRVADFDLVLNGHVTEGAWLVF